MFVNLIKNIEISSKGKMDIREGKSVNAHHHEEDCRKQSRESFVQGPWVVEVNRYEQIFIEDAEERGDQKRHIGKTLDPVSKDLEENIGEG